MCFLGGRICANPLLKHLQQPSSVKYPVAYHEHRLCLSEYCVSFNRWLRRSFLCVCTVPAEIELFILVDSFCLRLLGEWILVRRRDLR